MKLDYEGLVILEVPYEHDREKIDQVDFAYLKVKCVGLEEWHLLGLFV